MSIQSPSISQHFVQPDWPAPNTIKAYSTTCSGGISVAPFESLNVALHVGDSPQNVNQNRQQLIESGFLPNPQWLEQIHSIKVVEHQVLDTCPKADATYTTNARQACVVMTADCLPILLCNQAGDWVASVHAGWRGLADGIVYETVKHYQGETSLMAWIGPAISQTYFEVGDEVKELFVNNNNELEKYFKVSHKQKWLCDLTAIARYQLEQLSVSVYLSGLCTYQDSERFFSHRRATHQGLTQTGRMATVIWINETLGQSELIKQGRRL